MTVSPVGLLRRRRARPGEGFDRRLIGPMILGAVLNPINSSIIAVSLVPIGVAFGAPPARTAWLVPRSTWPPPSASPSSGGWSTRTGRAGCTLPGPRWSASPGSSGPSPRH